MVLVGREVLAEQNLRAGERAWDGCSAGRLGFNLGSRQASATWMKSQGIRCNEVNW